MKNNIEKWRTVKVSQIGKFYNGLSGKNKDDFLDGNENYITYSNVYKNVFASKEKLETVLIGKEEKQNAVEYGDLLFTQSSETLDEVGLTSVWLYNFKVYLNSFCFGFRIKNKQVLDPIYAAYLFRSYNVRKKIVKEGQGTIRVNLSSKRLEKVRLLLPPMLEQKKIAGILLTWDETIRSLSNMIMEERKKKKSIVSRIYRGHISKKTKETIKYSRLKNNLTEVTLRNNEDNGLVLSVSNTKGFIPQSEQFDREVASKNRSNYKIIKKTQFAYNPSRINVGSIDMLTSFESGILSPMYVVFETKDNLNSRYLYHFLKSDLFLQIIPRYTQGSVRDSLSFKGLSSMKIYLPELEEQNLYAEALDTIDYYIEKLEKLKELYKAQKQGLMQQLLTGKIRVNLN